MGFALDIGTGFFQKAQQVQDENRAEAANQRKFFMNTWATTTLPQAMKQRELDNTALATMNRLSAVESFQGQPELAFVAAKAITSGAYRNESEFLAEYEKNPSIAPPAVLARQKEALSKTFNYQVDETTGKVSNFTFKDTPAAPQAPVPGGKRSFSDIIMNKSNMAQNAQEARGEFMGGTGVDPTAPVTSRFDNAPTSGTISLKMRDKEAEQLKMMGMEAYARNPDMLRDAGDFYSALITGDKAKIAEVTSKKGFVISKEEADQNQFNRSFRLRMAEMAVSGEFKDPGVLTSIVNGEGNIAEILTKNIRTPEEKAAIQAQVDGIKAAVGSLDSPEAFLMYKAGGLLDKLPISPQQLSAMETEARTAIANKQSALDAFRRQAMGNLTPPSPTNAPPANVGSPALPQQTPVRPPRMEEPQPPPSANNIERLPGAFALDEEYLPPNQEPIGGRGKSVQTRLGEYPDGRPQTGSSVLTTAMIDGDEDSLQSANPYAILKQFSSVRDKATDPAKIVNSIRFSPADESRLKDRQFRQDIDFTQLKPYLPTFNSMEEAAKTVPTGGLAIVKGQYVIMQQAVKDQYGN